MNEFNQEQSTITHEKLEELRTLCNMLCDKTIHLFESATVRAKSESKRIKQTTRDAIYNNMINKNFTLGIKYVFNMLVKTIGISFVDINPAFVKAESFSEFKELEVKRILETDVGNVIQDMESIHLKAINVYIDHFERIIESAKELKEKIGSDYKYVLLCYKGLIKSYNQPAESYEDLIMLHNAMTECGIVPKYTIRETIEERNTKLLRVRDFVKNHLIKYEYDRDINQELNKTTIKM